MRGRVIPAVALLLSVVAALSPWPAPAQPAADPAPPPRGAKELFYDPTGGGSSSAQPEAAASPVAVAPAAAPATGAAVTESSASSPATAAAKRKARPAYRKSSAARTGSGRRQVALPANPAAQQAIGISYWIELVAGDGGPGTQVTDARTFHSGERIRLHFRSNADGEVALVQLGASGMAAVLFPDPDKGLANGRLVADEERILPSAAQWFRFDEVPGSEKILVLFARRRQDLESFPLRPAMDSQATAALVRSARQVRGSKDLFVETEAHAAAEIGTYGVNVAGRPVVLEINLKHR